MQGDQGLYRGVRSCHVAAGGFVLVLLSLLGACAGPASRVRAPDDQFGHRYDGYQGRRQTVAITPMDTTVSYFFYPVYVDSLHIRPAPFDSSAGADPRVLVEVLVKVALPDGCSELHAVEQQRVGHFIYLDVQMRRPRGASCVRVERPFRYYMTLDGRYGPGDYIIRIRDLVFPFVVRSPESTGTTTR
jgi:hypothetical protein